MPLFRMLFGLTMLLAAAAHAEAEIVDGAFLFNKRCGLCHNATALMPALTKLPNDAERQAFLEKFLSRHHARDAEERELIVEYLLRHQPRE